MREIGQITPEPGLYHCVICGAEIRLQAGESFPPCPGKDHSPRWILSEERILAASAGNYPRATDVRLQQ